MSMRKLCLLALMAALITLCVCACQRGNTTPDTGTEAPTQAASDPNTTRDEVTDPATEPDTPAVTTPETLEETTMEQETVFAPDPTLAVPQYDALMRDLDNFPFRFTYNNTAYHGFVGFEVVSTASTAITNGTETETVLTHPTINAVFRLISRVYPGESAYEYVIYIENHSDENTGAFKDPEFNITFAGETVTLRGLEGDAGASWYQEYEKKLSETGSKRFSQTSTSGRPTHVTFPYYNLIHGGEDGTTGTFIALGWPGTWHAQFLYRDGVTTLQAGQNAVNTFIAPGETFRTPLMAFVEYEGMDADAQTNAWRHYFLNDVMRHPNGELPQTVSTGYGNVVQGESTQKILNILKVYEKHNISMSGLWIDAGWYVGANGETVGWPSTGTQVVDTSRFPDKMATIGQYCKEHGMQFLLWFEPEDIRLDKDAFLAFDPAFKEEWLLDKTMEGTWLEGYLLDLGNAEAREWLLERVCTVIDEAGVTWYRQDFNSDPAGSWAKNDGAGRAGMTENQYVQGYLAYWDALIARYPDMMIDSCASGGGRNDLETMKRSVPLHYSDLFDGGNDDYNNKARMTQSLFAWFPYFKNENHADGLYNLRMNYAPWSTLRLSSVMAKDADWDTLTKCYAEWNRIQQFFYADYYQLTPYSTEKDRWNAWEFYDADTRSGYASLSCNPDCTTLSKTFCLRGLDPDASYTVSDDDGIVHVTATGRALMEEGIAVTVPHASYCVILNIAPAA